MTFFLISRKTVIAAAFLFANPAYGDPLPKVDPKYDRDNSGFVEPGRELDVYIRHQNNSILAEFDINLNGRLDQAEFARYNAGTASENEIRILLVRDDLLLDIGAGQGLPLAETSDPNTAPKTGWKRTFRLRTSFAYPSVSEGVSDDIAVRATSPFTLAFHRSNVSGQKNWSAKGAAFMEWRRDFTDRASLQTAAISAGVEVDRIVENGATISDTVAFRLGGNWLLQNSSQGAIIRSHYLSANVGWITDSDFDLSVLSAQARYRPLFNGEGFAGSFFGSGKILRKFVPILRLDYLHVNNAAGQAQFATAQDYLFVGASFEAFGKFRSGVLQPLTLRAKVQAVKDIGNSGDIREYYEAGLGWALTAGNHASINLTYKKGQTPFSGYVDQIDLGIGLSF